MIKWLLYTLGIFVVNVVATFALLIAFFLFLLRGDWIFAVLPVLLVAPVIVFQPWFLACLLGGLFFAPFLTTALTVLIYGSLNLTGALERPKQFFSRFRNRKTFAVVCGFYLLLFAAMFARYVDFPALRHGLPPYLEYTRVNVTDSRYYCLGQFIDSEWLWKARIQESELAVVTNRFRLQPVEGKQLPDEFFAMPPYWWNPSISDGTRVFSTPNFPLNERGEDGWYALAIWNPDDQLLYVWIKDNF